MHEITDKTYIARESCLKAAGKKVKEAVQRNLPIGSGIKHTKKGKIKVHMKDDVRSTIQEDKDGSISAVVSGGKHTGTLWHLVNDGFYNVKAGRMIPGTNFIDKALNESDNDVEKVIDETLEGMAIWL